MHSQRNATQRIPQLYLNNNFKFYIFQFFRAFNFLSVFIRFAKTQFANLITRWLQPLVLTIQRNASEYNYAQWVKTHCYKKWIVSLIPFVRNDNFNYAFSYALKNKFEIISQSDYGFCYKNYFFNLNQVFRNSYDFGERFGRNLNYDFEKIIMAVSEKIISGIVILVLILEMKFVALEIVWRAFYLIEKLKKYLCQRFSVGEGEQK